MRCETCEGAAERRGAFVVCPRCRTARHDLEPDRALTIPRGFDLAWVLPADERAIGYREAAPDGAHVVSRTWWRRWGFQGAFMIVWGGFAALWGSIVAIGPFFAGHGTHGVVVTLAMGLAVLAIGGGALYLAFANLLNRTHVLVSSSTIERRHAPLPWWGAWTIVREKKPKVGALGVRENDVRNAAARWPAPPTHSVTITYPDRAPLVLFEQITDQGDARAVASLVRAALRR